MFLQVRRVAHERVVHAIREPAPDLASSAAQRLATYALAAADGLFVAREIGGDDVDLLDMHTHALIDTVARMREDQ